MQNRPVIRFEILRIVGEMRGVGVRRADSHSGSP